MKDKEITDTVLNFYPEAEAVYLFGSYGTAQQNSSSDVDIAVLLPPETFKAAENIATSACARALEDILGRTVDMINLRRTNTVFQYEIIQDGRVIYRQSENVIDAFEMSVISSYQKLNEERAGIVADIIETGRILR